MTVKGMSSLKKAEIPPKDLSDEGKCLLAAEEEANAIQTYLNMADNTSDERLKDNFQEVAEDEMEHLGKDLATATHIRPELAEYMSKGVDEAEEEGFDIDRAIAELTGGKDDEGIPFDRDIVDMHVMKSMSKSSSPEAVLYMAFVKASRRGEIDVTRGFLNWILQDSESFAKAGDLRDFRDRNYSFDEDLIDSLFSTNWRDVQKQKGRNKLLENALRRLDKKGRGYYKGKPTSKAELDEIADTYDTAARKYKEGLMGTTPKRTMFNYRTLNRLYRNLQLARFINYLISRGATYPMGFGRNSDQSEEKPVEPTEETTAGPTGEESVESTEEATTVPDWYSDGVKAVNDYLGGLDENEREDTNWIWDLLSGSMSSQTGGTRLANPEEADEIFDKLIEKLLGVDNFKEGTPREELMQSLSDVSKVRHLANLFQGRPTSPKSYARDLIKDISDRVNNAMAEYTANDINDSVNRNLYPEANKANPKADKVDDKTSLEKTKEQKEIEAANTALQNAFKDPSIMAQLYWLKQMGVDMGEMFKILDESSRVKFGVERDRLGNAIKVPYNKQLALTETPRKMFGMPYNVWMRLKEIFSGRKDAYFPVGNRNEYNGVNLNRYDINDIEPLIRDFAKIFAEKEAKTKKKKPGEVKVGKKHLAMAFNLANILGIPYKANDLIRNASDGVLNIQSLDDFKGLEGDAKPTDPNAALVGDLVGKYKGNIWNSVGSEDIRAPTGSEAQFIQDMAERVRPPAFLEDHSTHKGLNNFLEAASHDDFLSDLKQSAAENGTSVEGLDELVQELQSGMPFTYSMLGKVLSNDTLTNRLLKELNKGNIFDRSSDVTPETLASAIEENKNYYSGDIGEDSEKLGRLRSTLDRGLANNSTYKKLYDKDEVFKIILDRVYDGHLDVFDKEFMDAVKKSMKDAGSSDADIAGFANSVDLVKKFVTPLLSSAADNAILTPMKRELSDAKLREDVKAMRNWISTHRENKLTMQNIIDAAWALTDNDIKRQRTDDNVDTYGQLVGSRSKMMDSIPIFIMNDLVESIPRETLMNIQRMRAIQSKALTGRTLTSDESNFLTLMNIGRKYRDELQKATAKKGEPLTPDDETFLSVPDIKPGAESELYKYIQEIKTKVKMKKPLSYKEKQDLATFNALNMDELHKGLVDQYDGIRSKWTDDAGFVKWAMEESDNPAIRFIGSIIDDLNKHEAGWKQFKEERKDETEDKTDWSKGPEVRLYSKGVKIPTIVPWYDISSTNFLRGWLYPVLDSLKHTAGFGGGDISDPQVVLHNLLNLRNDQVGESLNRKKLAAADEGYSYFPWIDPGTPYDKQRIFSLDPSEEARRIHNIEDEKQITQFLPEFISTSVDEKGKSNGTVMDKLFNTLLFPPKFEEGDIEKYGGYEGLMKYRRDNAKVLGNDWGVQNAANKEGKGGKNAKKRAFLSEEYGKPIGWVDDNGKRHFFDSDSEKGPKSLEDLAYVYYKAALDADHNAGAREYLDRMIREPGYDTDSMGYMGLSDSFMKPTEYEDWGYVEDDNGNEFHVRTPRHRMGGMDISPAKLLMRYATARHNEMYPKDKELMGARLGDELPAVVYAPDHTKGASYHWSVPSVVSQAIGAYNKGLVDNKNGVSAKDYNNIYQSDADMDDKKEEERPLSHWLELYAKLTGMWDNYGDSDIVVSDNAVRDEHMNGTPKPGENDDQTPPVNEAAKAIADVQNDDELTDMQQASILAGNEPTVDTVFGPRPGATPQELEEFGKRLEEKKKALEEENRAKPFEKSSSAFKHIEGAKTRILDPSLDKGHIHTGRPAPMWQPADYVISLQDPDREYVKEDEPWDIDEEIKKRQKR